MNRSARRLLAVASLAALVGAVVTPPARADLPRRYRAIEIPLPPTGDCSGQTHFIMNTRRLNDRGQLIGKASCYGETGFPEIPFDIVGGVSYVWSAATGTYELRPALPESLELEARDINDSGNAVGWEGADDGFRPTYIPSGGTAVVPYDAPECGGFVLTRADDIDNRGRILGSRRAPQPDGTCRTTWILVSPGRTELVGPPGSPAQALNESGIASGISQNRFVRWDTNTNRVTVLKDGAVGPNPGDGVFPLYSNINARGDVVGSVERRVNSLLVESTSYLWRANGKERVLPTLDGLPIVVVRDISDSGVAVGSVSPAIPVNESRLEVARAVAWDDDKVVDLTARLPARARIQLTDASAIDRFGRIAARGHRLDDVPLPCPVYTYNEETGEFESDPTRVCRPERAFLLVPND